jgi:hypothetical protein
MAENKHWLDWTAVGISLFALTISGMTLFRTFLFQRDDIRFVMNAMHLCPIGEKPNVEL